MCIRDSRWGGSVSDGVRLLDQALARDPLATMPAPDRPYTMLVSQYANFGRADRARQLYTQMVADSVMPAGGRQAQYLPGWVEVAEGQYAPGLARIRLNADPDYCADWPGERLGGAVDRAPVGGFGADLAHHSATGSGGHGGTRPHTHGGGQAVWT